ncbi:MAG: DUF2252 family protein [Bacteroidota bacterium]|nr:DUF2252 family protein [Bacteroidota bacterium]
MQNNNNRDKLVVDEIKLFNESISSKSREQKYKKMLRTPFYFFRGTNHLFWKDLYSDERLNLFANKNTNTWILGDLHVCNIGIFNNAIEQIVFDFNDFDESFIGDFQFDIWRMAVSIILIAREVFDISTHEEEKIIEKFAERYIKSVANFYENNEALSLNFTKHNTKHQLEERLKDAEDDKGVEDMLDKWTSIKDGERKLDNHEIIDISEQKQKEIAQAMTDYGKTLSGKLKYDIIYFDILDIAKRIDAGTGSLGIPRYYILINGASDGKETFRILDVKLQNKPSAYLFLNDNDKKIFDKRFPSQAKRFVDANKSLNLLHDNHLGYMLLYDGEYSVRQRSPYKSDFRYKDLKDKDALENQVKQWAEVIATTHVRAADTYFKKEIASIYNDKMKAFLTNVVEISQEYADIVVNDYNIFSEWLK